jgi:hypothetical protein
MTRFVVELSDLTRLPVAAIVALLVHSPASAATYCDATGCSLPDHLGDVQVITEFLSKAGIPVKIANCKPGLLGQFSSRPASTGSMTICTSALRRGVAGVSETFRHELIHAAQFCKARNNGRSGFWTISDDKNHILKQSKQVGAYRHVGGEYGLLSEHEAYKYESARPRDVLYIFNNYCIDRKRTNAGW